MITKLVIFDLDGTLLNTISDLGNACNYALKEMGFPQHELPEYNRMVGNGLRKLIERAALVGSSAQTIDNLVTLCREYYDKHLIDTTTPYPGIPELLRNLQDEGVKIAVASNKYQSAVERIVPHFFPNIRFAAIEGQREGRPIKPDPAIVIDIMKIAGVTRDETVMIGDSEVDMETARRAGIRDITVAWGFAPAGVLQKFNPSHLVDSTSQIYALVK